MGVDSVGERQVWRSGSPGVRTQSRTARRCGRSTDSTRPPGDRPATISQPGLRQDDLQVHRCRGQRSPCIRLPLLPFQTGPGPELLRELDEVALDSDRICGGRVRLVSRSRQGTRHLDGNARNRSGDSHGIASMVLIDGPRYKELKPLAERWISTYRAPLLAYGRRREVRGGGGDSGRGGPSGCRRRAPSPHPRRDDDRPSPHARTDPHPSQDGQRSHRWRCCPTITPRFIAVQTPSHIQSRYRTSGREVAPAALQHPGAVVDTWMRGSTWRTYQRPMPSGSISQTRSSTSGSNRHSMVTLALRR